MVKEDKHVEKLIRTLELLDLQPDVVIYRDKLGGIRYRDFGNGRYVTRKDALDVLTHQFPEPNQDA